MILRYFKNCQQTMAKVQNKEISNVIPSSKTLRYEIKVDAMDGMFSTHSGCIQRFGWKTSREGTAWEAYV
jgi:hypothetical protein